MVCAAAQELVFFEQQAINVCRALVQSFCGWKIAAARPSRRNRSALVSHFAWFETLAQFAFCVRASGCLFSDLCAVWFRREGLILLGLRHWRSWRLREGLIFIFGGVFCKKIKNFCKKVGSFGEKWGKMVTNVQMA